MVTKGTEPEIRFTPLTDGLGFHPFSDGLPYAPVSKTPQTPRRLQQGTGAIAAGPPKMAPKISVPISSAARPVKKLAPKPVAETQAQPQIAGPHYGFLYLFKRMAAYTIDSMLNVSLLVTGLSFIILRQELESNFLLTWTTVILGALFVLVFNWAAIVAQEVAFGTSIGKRIFGLWLNGNPMTIFIRGFLFVLGLVFLGTGLLWAAFNRDRRCWHDVALDLQPLEAAKL
jgi:uncharacterized RDD family membrane protein YckC